MKNKKYQKTIIITTILIILVALFGFISNNFAVGYYEQTLQPVPLQVEVTPSQNWLNEQTRNNLIATYGISLFNSCSKSEKRCTSSMN